MQGSTGFESCCKIDVTIIVTDISRVKRIVENLEVLSMISPGDRPQMTTTKSFNQNEAYPEDEKRVVVLSVECK